MTPYREVLFLFPARKSYVTWPRLTGQVATDVSKCLNSGKLALEPMHLNAA